jgi:hypothetical protein
VNVNDLIDRVTELNLNGFPRQHVALVCDTVEVLKPDIICEWGTKDGNSCRLLFEASALSPGCRVHSIENAKLDAPPLLSGCDVLLHHGDGPTITLRLIKGFKRPLILIDDHHVYQDTLDNLATFALEAPGAVLLIHDAGLGRSEASYAIRAFLRRGGNYVLSESTDESGLVRLWPQ